MLRANQIRVGISLFWTDSFKVCNKLHPVANLLSYPRGSEKAELTANLCFEQIWDLSE